MATAKRKSPKRPKRSAAHRPAPKPAPAAAPTVQHHQVLGELLRKHRATLHGEPELKGTVLHAKCHSPASIEQFVGELVNHPHVREVRVTPAHIEIEIEPAAEAKK